jgi:hypothetical protein
MFYENLYQKAIERGLQLTRISNASFQFKVQFPLIRINEFC